MSMKAGASLASKEPQIDTPIAHQAITSTRFSGCIGIGGVIRNVHPVQDSL